MITCSKCVLPESYPNISFDLDGVCNFCNSFVPPIYEGRDALVKIIKELKNPTCKYDAILGMSGGRDSTYAAYFAVRELGLKIMGFTYDNGFIPETIWDNIHKAVSILGIEHTIVRADYLKKSVKSVLHAISHKPSPAMVAFLCSGCQTGIKQNIIKVAERLDCPTILTGGGEPENTFAEHLLTGSNERRNRNKILGFLREMSNNPHYLNPRLLVSFSKEFYHRFFHKPKSIIYVDLFHYIEWDENKIMETITQVLKWQKPDEISASWRADCKINVIRQYLYLNMLGFAKNEELLSQLIRNKKITRENALTRLESDNHINQDFLLEIFNELDFNPEVLFRSLKME